MRLAAMAIEIAPNSERNTMNSSIVLFDDAETHVPTSPVVATIGHQTPTPSESILGAADLVELILGQWSEYESVSRLATSAFIEIGRAIPPVIVRLHVALAASTSDAMRLFESKVTASEHLSNLWYVGTNSGLSGLFADLKRLNLGNGVHLVPLT